jgi:protein tyrosine phosphatase
MRAGDNEETRVKLVQTVENLVYLYDYSHEYYADNKEAAWRGRVTRK